MSYDHKPVCQLAMKYVLPTAWPLTATPPIVTFVTSSKPFDLERTSPCAPGGTAPAATTAIAIAMRVTRGIICPSAPCGPQRPEVSASSPPLSAFASLMVTTPEGQLP